MAVGDKNVAQQILKIITAWKTIFKNIIGNFTLLYEKRYQIQTLQAWKYFNLFATQKAVNFEKGIDFP